MRGFVQLLAEGAFMVEVLFSKIKIEVVLFGRGLFTFSDHSYTFWDWNWLFLGPGGFSWSRALFRDYGFDDQRFFLDLYYFSIAFLSLSGTLSKDSDNKLKAQDKVFSPSFSI